MGGGEKAGYRAIFRLDASDFERRAGGMPEGAVVEELRKDVGADSCETWWSEKIEARIVVFRWVTLPPLDVQRPRPRSAARSWPSSAPAPHNWRDSTGCPVT